MADTGFQIVLYDADGNSRTCTIDELLPHAFTANLIG
jgi:cytidine deaminase